MTAAGVGRGGYMPPTPASSFMPLAPHWVPLQPDEKVMQPDGVVLDAWEYHLLSRLSGGYDESGRR